MAYTSIQTTGGWADNAVQAAWDLMFNWALKPRLLFMPLVDVQPEQVPHRGDSITSQLNQYFSEADVVAATTPLTEESDVTPTQLPITTTVTYTPQEYGLAVVRTLKLANRSLTDVDPVISAAVARHAAETMDRLVQIEARTGTNVRYAQGNASSTATVAAADTLTGEDIRYCVTKLKDASADYRGGNGSFYVGVFDPDLIHDLRVDQTAANWRTPKEYTDPAEIYNGEFGEFEGVRFVSSPSVYWTADQADGATSQGVHRGHILGREALGKAVVTAPHTVISPVIDSLRRNAGIGWYADLDFQVYRNEALWRVEASSTIA